MRVLLMHPDRDFDSGQPPLWNEEALAQDLALAPLLQAMAGGDRFLLDVAGRALFSGFQNDLDTIRYRQEAVQDCLRNGDIVRALYALAVQAIERKREYWWGLNSRSAAATLYGSTGLLRMLVTMLENLRAMADAHGSRFTSTAFTQLFATLRAELADDYLARVRTHLADLRFRDGLLLSADLGDINQGVNYTLRESPLMRRGWLERILGTAPSGYTFRLHERDEAGRRALGDIRDRGINLVANAIAQSADHVLAFFTVLRTELAFYVGCLNLHAQLDARRLPVAFPVCVPAGERRHRFCELYDPSLALTIKGPVVGNSANADGRSLTIITGANQGGKSTFLRSIGVAQLMMQCGLFVAAAAFTAARCPAVCTHYRREEDATMRSGKLDEELSRMSAIADHLQPDAMLLFNESFAATNAREGSEIARQVVSALLDKRIRVFYVTHLYELAHGFAERRRVDTLFLRAERQADGTRTFRLVESEPLETSYGEDLYRVRYRS